MALDMAKDMNPNNLNSAGAVTGRNTNPGKFSSFVKEHKKLMLGIVVVLLAIFLIPKMFSPRKTTSTVASVQSVSTKVDRGYDFNALNNQGKPIPTSTASAAQIKLTITTAEKTSQVLVGDKTFSAKNNKMFLILNLELRNDSSTQANIIPGDLIRLTYGGDESRKFAPDLHNNLVPVAAISTKIDRVGFVVPDSEKIFKIYIGELDGRKDIVTVAFGS